MLRKALYNDYYNQSNVANGFAHTDHCITSLRESVMCSADVTPFVWAWHEETQRSVPRADTLHSCRNFGKVRQWAKDHEIDREFLTEIHIEDDLERVNIFHQG